MKTLPRRVHASFQSRWINRLFWCSLGGILLPCWLFSQPKVLTSNILSERDGLPGYYYHDILQHSDGILWIASSLGLTRYDGYRFEVFNSFNNGLSGINLEKIQEYKDGRLIISYVDEKGFFDLFNPDDFSLTRISLEEKGVSGEIRHFFAEPRGDLFILTEQNNQLIVYRFDGKDQFDRLFSIPLPANRPGKPAASLLRDSEGLFWISDSRSHLFLTGPSGKVIRVFKSTEFEGLENQPFLPVWKLHQDRGGRTWLFPKGPDSGIFVFTKGDKTWRRFQSLPQSRTYDRLWEDQEGNLLFKSGYQEWYSPTEKLYCLSRFGKVTDYSGLIPFNEYILSVFSQDFFRFIFIGAGSVIRHIRFNQLETRTYLSRDLEEGQWGTSIRGIGGDGYGSVFLIREMDNWYQIDLRTNRMDTLPLRITDTGDSIFWRQGRGVFADQRYVWSAGTLAWKRYALMRYDRKKKQFHPFEYRLPVRDFIPADSCGFWLACGNSDEGELVFFDTCSQQFIPYRNADGANPLHGLLPDRIFVGQNREIWIGTTTGLARINPQKQQSWVYGRDKRDSHGLTNHTIHAIQEDMSGRIWLGTNGGLNVFDPQKERVVAVYRMENGLAGNRISNILPDEKGNFWISTYSGLSFFDRKSNRFFNFFRSDGLPFEEISRLTLFKDEQGRLYIGGLNGAASFRPAGLLVDKFYEKPVLTGWKYYDERKGALVQHKQNLNAGGALRLAPSVTFLECEFTLPFYEDPASHQYSAWLENSGKSWNYLGNSPFIRLNKLPPGDYRLHIRATDNHGNPTRKDLTLDIHVEPRFFQTIFFRCLAVLFILLVAGAAYRILLSRQLAIERAERLKELDQVKTRLYSNITHEFRTPLTIIIGLTRQLISKVSREDTRNSLKQVSQNGERLLHLVNQILDLRKVQEGNLKPELRLGSISPMLHFLADSFSALAGTRKINLSFDAVPEEIILDHDREILIKVLSNLLSNAIRFTPEEGEVQLLADASDDTFLRITVRDSGVGIPAAQLPFIFERFYQADNQVKGAGEGTGIGLTLVKELVELLGGSISVQSTEGEGATFFLVLPISRKADPAPESVPAAFQPLPLLVEGEAQGRRKNRKNKPLVLIVEDNEEVAQYIGSCLEKDYLRLYAPDGEAGIQVALDRVPDLIISDVMMPKADGFQLCQILKTDERTSHIPIILLTALGEADNRLKGLSKGADAYLSKPFLEEELRLHARNLLRLRKQMRRYLKVANPVELSPIPAADWLEGEDTRVDSGFDLERENEFLEKIYAVIEENFANPDFQVADLCRELTMSNSQLHRKLKALTGKSANPMLTEFRINKAKELLRQTKLPVGEVAFKTGFNDPSYFTRIFTKFTGLNPSDFRG